MINFTKWNKYKRQFACPSMNQIESIVIFLVEQTVCGDPYELLVYTANDACNDDVQNQNDATCGWYDIYIKI